MSTEKPAQPRHPFSGPSVPPTRPGLQVGLPTVAQEENYMAGGTGGEGERDPGERRAEAGGGAAHAELLSQSGVRQASPA